MLLHCVIVDSVLLSSVSDVMLSSDDQYGQSAADKVIVIIIIIIRQLIRRHNMAKVTLRAPFKVSCSCLGMHSRF